MARAKGSIKRETKEKDGREDRVKRRSVKKNVWRGSGREERGESR